MCGPENRNLLDKYEVGREGTAVNLLLTSIAVVKPTRQVRSIPPPSSAGEGQGCYNATDFDLLPVLKNVLT